MTNSSAIESIIFSSYGTIRKLLINVIPSLYFHQRPLEEENFSYQFLCFPTFALFRWAQLFFFTTILGVIFIKAVLYKVALTSVTFDSDAYFRNEMQKQKLKREEKLWAFYANIYAPVRCEVEMGKKFDQRIHCGKKDRILSMNIMWRIVQDHLHSKLCYL